MIVGASHLQGKRSPLSFMLASALLSIGLGTLSTASRVLFF